MIHGSALSVKDCFRKHEARRDYISGAPPWQPEELPNWPNRTSYPTARLHLKFVHRITSMAHKRNYSNSSTSAAQPCTVTTIFGNAHDGSLQSVDQVPLSFAGEWNSIVERFKQGKLEKYATHFRLARAAICDSPGGTEETSAKLGPFQRMVDHIDNEWLSVRTPPRFFIQRVVRGPEKSNRSRTTGLQIHNKAPPVIRRGVHQLEEDTPEQPAKKRRAEPDLSNLDHKNGLSRNISPNLRCTFNVLASWASNVQEVKQRFINPPVNLDVVLSNRSSRSRPAVTVTTISEWTVTWISLARAYRFAFPHREDEHDAYGDYINNKFCSTVAAAHFKVIDFDKAV
ncbi:uncharacterized protein EDB91DRAFT_1087199 [Suillus paluster]|uniref:uncharacterized protein n=1 Tax=Suillus paluster TaxID=48578 RepID=UPI001B87476C|nr:uncharacterized protein EDB91DRAFT_1087199 [Suillus paluster]KAG1725282.1 hypothetical protein EDB91DRAFT_1087199 [Suillus paluster]